MTRSTAAPARRLRWGAAAIACLGALAFAPAASANHVVFVEGNCGTPDAVNPGSCGDYDGDGRVGAAEDRDTTDRIFGTINGAVGETDLGSAALNMTAANQNGRVVVVADGQYPEVVRLGRTDRNPTPGNITLEGARGVEADIDAVVQGEGNAAALQTQPGIVVDSPADRRVTIRNITTRNWTDGIRVEGISRVTIDDVKAEGNVAYGLQVTGSSRATVRDSQIQSSGFRVNPMAASNAPDPGIGIEVSRRARASIFGGTISDNFRAGVSNDTPGATSRSRRTRARAARRVLLGDSVQLFDNRRDVRGAVTVVND